MLDRIFSFDTLWWLLMLLYIPSCIGLIVIVLLQKGKGTGFAGAFGAGAGPGADTVFGPRMSRSLPIRLTYAAATLFMVIAVIMSLIAGRVGKGVAPELVEGGIDAPRAAVASDALTRLGLGANNADPSRYDNATLPPDLEESAESETEAHVEEAGSEEGEAEAQDEAAAEDAAADPEAEAEPADESETDAAVVEESPGDTPELQ